MKKVISLMVALFLMAVINPFDILSNNAVYFLLIAVSIYTTLWILFYLPKQSKFLSNHPSKLKLILTHRCAFNCDYCCNKQLQPVKPLIDIQAIRAYKELHLTGGDPFYAENIMPLLILIKSFYEGKVYIWTSFFYNRNEDSQILIKMLLYSHGITYTVHDYFLQKNTMTLIMNYMDMLKIPKNQIRFKVIRKHMPFAIEDMGISYNWMPWDPEIDCPLPKDIAIKSYLNYQP